MKWYRSLYWRIAVGIVAFLAAMLVVQAMLFVWAVSRSGRTLPGQMPGRLGETVAADLSGLLEREPQTDLSKYIKEEYAEDAHPFFVVMSDSRVFTNSSEVIPEPLFNMTRVWLERPRRF